MGRALILGCSHAAGAEMEKAPDLAESTACFDFGIKNSYPALVAEMLGYLPDNRAIPGGSNDAMFRIFTEQLNQLTAGDVVIACWTGGNRTEIWHELDQQWLALCPGRIGFSRNPKEKPWDPVQDHDLYVKYQHQWNLFNTGVELGRLNKIKNIIALNTLAQAQGIQVINVDSFAPITNFNWPADIKWPVDVSFLNWVEQHNYPSTQFKHYFLAAHQSYANLIKTYL